MQELHQSASRSRSVHPYSFETPTLHVFFLLVQEDVYTPGTEAYSVLIHMHTTYAWAVNSKVLGGHC